MKSLPAPCWSALLLVVAVHAAPAAVLAASSTAASPAAAAAPPEASASPAQAAAAAPPPGFRHQVLQDPRLTFAGVSAIVASLGIVFSVITFAWSQAQQRRIRRAETIQHLIDWFREERSEDAVVRNVSDELVYGTTTWAFSLPDDLQTEKEKGLARLLSMLNHLALHVELGLIKASDLGCTDPGYFFAVVARNPHIEAYLQHIESNDLSLGRPPKSGFHYLRKHALAIGFGHGRGGAT